MEKNPDNRTNRATYRYRFCILPINSKTKTVDNIVANHLDKNTTFDHHPQHEGPCLNFYEVVDSFWKEHGLCKIQSNPEPKLPKIHCKDGLVDRIVKTSKIHKVEKESCSAIKKRVNIPVCCNCDDKMELDNKDQPAIEYTNEDWNSKGSQSYLYGNKLEVVDYRKSIVGWL